MNTIPEQLIHLLKEFENKAFENNWLYYHNKCQRKLDEASILIEKTKNTILENNDNDNNKNKTALQGYCLIQRYLAFNDTFMNLIHFLLNRNENLIFESLINYNNGPTTYGYQTLPGGSLPLHSILHHGENASVDVIRLLLMYDEGKKTLLEKDAYGRLPFHVACMRAASVEMMKLVLVDDDDDDGKKTCIFGKDRFGNTPLHYLCCYHEESARIVEQIEFLLDHDNNKDANKSLLFIKNDEGRLPLHVACENNASIEVIKFLLLKCDKLGKKYSMMLLEKDRHDNIPLHYACCCTQSDDDCRQNNNSLEVIKLLLEHDNDDDGEEKKSLLEKGNRKRLPIDYAREKRAPSDVIRFLLQWHIWVSSKKVLVPIKISFYRSKIDTFLRTCITKYQYREDTLESYDEKVKKFVSYCNLIEATTLLELVLQKNEFSHGIEVIMNRTMDFLVVKKEK